MLDLNPETVRFIIARAQMFQMLGQGDSGDRPDGWDSTYAELRATIGLPGAADVDVFAKTRALKDAF